MSEELPDEAAVGDPPLSATVVADPPPRKVEPSDESSELVIDDLLVEDVSIDGMCGVY